MKDEYNLNLKLLKKSVKYLETEGEEQLGVRINKKDKTFGMKTHTTVY